MASTYTDILRLTLPTTGELDGTWGTTVNTGITALIETALAGTANVTHDDTANYTLTTASGSADEARAMFLNITGSLGAARNVVCPTKSKLYFIKNGTTGGFAVTLKTTGGTGISVPNGKYMALYCDGTNVVEAINAMGAITATSVNKVAITAPATSATLALVEGTTVTGPSATSTLPGLSLANSFTAAQLIQPATDVAPLTLRGHASATANLLQLQDSSSVAKFTVSPAGAISAGTIAVGGITGLGTGVATALAVAVGSAGAPVVNGGALGTPSSGSAANLTSFPTLNQNTTGTAGGLTGTPNISVGTVTASGTVTGTAGFGAFTASATTGQACFLATSTGGYLVTGTNNSAGNGLLTGTSAYAAVIATLNTTDLVLGYNGLAKATITSTGLNSTAIGQTTPAAGSFTTLSASDQLTVGSGSTSNAGWLLKTYGTSGIGAMWNTGVTPDTTNYALVASSTATILNGKSSASIRVNGSEVAAISSTGLAVTAPSVNLTVNDTAAYSAGSSGATLLLGGLDSASTYANLGLIKVNALASQKSEMKFRVLDTAGAAVYPLSLNAGLVAAIGLLDLSASTAGQIKFPATQNASADANTLDDYKEGTWTPAMTASTSGTITLSAPTNTGLYTKIGREVTAYALCSVSSVSSPVGELRITGLPFANSAASRVPATIMIQLAAATATTASTAFVVESATHITVFTRYAAGACASNAADIVANTDVYVQVTYFV